MQSTLTISEWVQLRSRTFQFYENMHPDNIVDIDVIDTYRFTLPPYFTIEHNNLLFISNEYDQNIQLSSSDLEEMMGYITTSIRLLQIRFIRL